MLVAGSTKDTRHALHAILHPPRPSCQDICVTVQVLRFPSRSQGRRLRCGRSGGRERQVGGAADFQPGGLAQARRRSSAPRRLDEGRKCTPARLTSRAASWAGPAAARPASYSRDVDCSTSGGLSPLRGGSSHQPRPPRKSEQNVNKRIDKTSAVARGRGVSRRSRNRRERGRAPAIPAQAHATAD